MHCTCPEGQHIAPWARIWTYRCPLDNQPIPKVRPSLVRSSQWVSQR